ncbi:hypothetical protein WAK64_14080 [Bacillus spongiae]|uniref:YhfM-like domain-containing protein n=1 Tax=Bacillus spongiae TaxID=2683610 RepID=A0ABU8HGJ9_9BACI
MKSFQYFIVFIAIIIGGCSNGIETEEQYIEIQKRIGDENKYEDLREITDNEQVQNVKKIVDDIVWETAKVNMVRPADYKFVFIYKNPDIQVKVVLYELWISPNNEQVELVIGAASQYIQLGKDESAELFEILTSGKLSDQ